MIPYAKQGKRSNNMKSRNFICRQYEYNTYEKHVNAPLIRKNFTAEGFEKATLTVCGLGFYDIYLNGKRLTKGLLAPYISNPDDIIYFDEYDVSDTLVKGENAVCVILGNGMQNCPGGEVWDLDKALFRGPVRMSLAIECDGEKILESDTTFKTKDSPIYFDDLRSGEFYDARLENENVFSPSFDDSDWDNALLCECPRGEMRICEAEPIVKINELKCISVRKAVLAPYNPDRKELIKDTQEKVETREGYLYDFGVNTAGVPHLKIKGKAGQKISMQICEYVDENNDPSYANIYFYPEGYSQRDIYICKGGEEEYEPRFTYHGGRYVFVSGIEEDQAKNDLVTFCEYSSGLKEAGGFECSDKRANTLQEMVKRSDRANFYYFPTDCPHREKNGWTGDAAASCEQLMMNFHCENSFREWLRNIYRSQKPDGRIPGIIPTAGWGIEWGNGPAWDMAMILIPYTVYRYTDDITVLEESCESVFRYLSYLESRRKDSGLIDIGLGDWLQPLHYDCIPSAPTELTDSVLSAFICETASKIFRLLKKQHHEKFAMSLYEDFRLAVRENYINFATMTVKSNCQTAQAMCIYYNIFEKSELAKACDVLVETVHKNKDFLDCGLLGNRVIFRVLADCGEWDLAYKMITRDEFPSYGNFIKQGLTSLPEEFRENYQNPRPTSLNHHFFGDISAWFISYICGIRVNEKGISASFVDIKPCFVKKLDFAKAYRDLPCGRLSVQWERTGDKELLLKIQCPEQVCGELVLPKGYIIRESKNIFDRGRAVAKLRSGEYKIQYS